MPEDSKSKSKITIYELLALVLVAILAVSWFVQGSLRKNPAPEQTNNQAGLNNIILVASAEEIYPLFECPCCGKTIGECTCPMAKERRAYVDGLTAGQIPADEIMLAYVKKYGLASFIDKAKQAELREKLIQEAPASRPIISIAPSSYDFGQISQKEGIATTFFAIKNQGQSDLIIDSLETSCGCTSAAIVYQGNEGPKFSMPGHGLNEEIDNWQVAIAPGQTAQLKVYYDPNTHKDFRGTAIREINISSNDPIDWQKTVSIELEQVD